MALVPHGAGTSSVSLACPMLTAENYTVWAIKMEAILDAQGVWEAVVPEKGTTVDEKKNKTAHAQLLGALSEDILLQVSSKKKVAEVWDSLKTRFVGVDRVKAAHLSNLRAEFDHLDMSDGEKLDVFAGKISGMAARYAGLGATLGDAAMVKKLLDSVPDHLYTAVAGIEQFCDVNTITFDEALGRLKAFEERTERRKQRSGGERGDGQLLLTAAQWEAWRRARSGGYDDAASSADRGRRGIGKCNNCGVRGHFTRDCWKPKKRQEKEKALIADINVDDLPGLY